MRKQFEGMVVDQITIRMIAQMLDVLIPRTANLHRALLVDMFNHAAATTERSALLNWAVNGDEGEDTHLKPKSGLSRAL